MRRKKSVAMLIAISMLVSNVPIVMAKEEAVKIPSRSIYTHKEIIGKDRYETGRKVLEESKRFKNIIVVNGSEEKLVDGLCASGLVEKLNATILPINPKKVDKKSMEYINKAEKVYIIGENQAIPYSFEKSINKKVKVVRIGGKDRYETSEKIAKYIGSYDKAYLVNGAIGHPDAMSISSVAAKEKSPIILTKKDSSKVDKKKGVEYTAIGGTSVISNSLVSKYSAKRIGGETRYETNRMVLNKYYPNSSIRYFTNGETLVDALSAASISKNDGITFINRHKNHDLLEYIDTVQVGGFPYDVVFVNNGTGTGGSGGTVVPPSKPDIPEKPNPPEKPNTPPSIPEAKATVTKEFDKNLKYLVNIEITEKSIDTDGKIVGYEYKDGDIIEKLEEGKIYSSYYPIGNHEVQVRAVDNDKGVSEWFTVNFEVKEEEKATLKAGIFFNNDVRMKIILDNNGENVKKIRFIRSEDENKDDIKNPIYLDKNGAIKGYILNDEFIISSDKIICANENSNNMFDGLSNIEQIELKNFYTGNSKHMSEMFSYCNNLKDIDISKLNTSDVIDMIRMFSGCNNLINMDLSKLSLENVETMESMFSNCDNLKEVNLSNPNLKNLKTMENMFWECENLKEVKFKNDLNSIHAPGLETMTNMFYNCKKLESIDLSNIKLPKIETMERMFYNCKKLESINLIGLDLKTLKTMGRIFEGCVELKSAYLSGLNLEMLKNMSHMFYGCSKLKTIKLDGINTPNLKNMSHMFSDCKSLVNSDTEDINILDLDTSNVGDMSSAFSGCENLTKIDLSNLDTSSLFDMQSMFFECRNLTAEFTIKSKGDILVKPAGPADPIENSLKGCSTEPETEFIINYTKNNELIAKRILYYFKESHIKLGREIEKN